MRDCYRARLRAGYVIEEETRNVGIDRAVELLCSRRGGEYRLAHREKQSLAAKLSRQIWCCPYCGHRRSAVRMEEGGGSLRLCSALRERVRRWGSRQLSLFEPEEELFLNAPVNLRGPQRCPACSLSSLPSKVQREVAIGRDDGVIELKAEICGARELLNAPWCVKGEITLRLPVFEVLCFDLARGEITLLLRGADGAVLGQTDCTDPSLEWKQGVIYPLLKYNAALRRALRREFDPLFVQGVPFGKTELSPESFLMMTQFSGFPRSFYDGIPYVLGSLRIEESFASAAACLRDPAGAVALYDNSRLPKCKSLRRRFFAMPALLFYREEWERLWEIVGDVNHLCRLLDGSGIFLLLSLLRRRPAYFTLLGDMALVKGAAAAISMAKDWIYSEEYAKDYCTLSEAGRLAEQRRWRELGAERCFGRENDPALLALRGVRRHPFSLPMAPFSQGVEDCWIRGFFFRRLRSANDFHWAGRALRNCLGALDKWGEDVYLIERDGRAVAAMDAENETVFQVLAYRNAAPATVKGLNEAVAEWAKRFGFELCRDWDDDDDDY